MYRYCYPSNGAIMYGLLSDSFLRARGGTYLGSPLLSLCCRTGRHVNLNQAFVCHTSFGTQRVSPLQLWPTCPHPSKLSINPTAALPKALLAKKTVWDPYAGQITAAVDLSAIGGQIRKTVAQMGDKPKTHSRVIQIRHSPLALQIRVSIC